MIKRNPNIAKLKENYLFPEIRQRKNAFLSQNPDARIISLGIGDTTEPIPEHICHALIRGASCLGSPSTYVGYGPEQGIEGLRQSIALKLYKNQVAADEIFISDGAKCDIGRLQWLFGNQIKIAVQDPSYPVYVDGSIMQGIESIVFLPCLPENDFFPDLQPAENVDLIYFCSPNNPTGSVASRQQLQRLVSFAKMNRCIIIFDSAYAAFKQDSSLPSSIYEIEGAREVAIEISSFSKIAGFTGVRLGWTIVPDELRFEDGTSVKKDWSRVIHTIFNGASNISQRGGIAILEEQGRREVQGLISHYMTNVSIIRNALESKGYEIYGGIHAPYLWVRIPQMKSWDAFQEFLEKYHLVTTPGSGFGPSGEGFLRFSAFCSREHITEAAKRVSSISD
jgi:LL-diaminopimelate aminotransferase